MLFYPSSKMLFGPDSESAAGNSLLYRFAHKESCIELVGDCVYVYIFITRCCRYFCSALKDSANCYTLEVSLYGYQRPNGQGIVPYTEDACILSMYARPLAPLSEKAAVLSHWGLRAHSNEIPSASPATRTPCR